MPKKRGRSKSPPFVMLPRALLEHPAVASLDHAHFRVLVALIKAHNGRNNGALGLTAKQAAAHGIARNTLYRALRELAARHLIAMTYPASRVPPRPAMYALEWLPLADTDYTTSTRLAGHGYRQWTAASTTEAKAALRVIAGGKGQQKCAS